MGQRVHDWIGGNPVVAAEIYPAYIHFLDYLVAKATPEEILAFQAADADQQRADELTEKNKAGRLTPEEAAELAQMLELNALVALLKARALKALSQP
jgi:hypothetical protein